MKKMPSTHALISDRRTERLSTYAWIVLGYTVAVILWGAYVRATGSGAGCGNHWPLCNGEVIPRPERVETLIEFTHRAMTGLLLPMVAILVILIFRTFPRRHPARGWAVWTGVFLIIEAMIGAGLVRLELVEDNASAARAVSIGLHLVNTYFLLASMTLTAQAITQDDPETSSRPLPLRPWLGLAFLGLLILGASGAVTALGDTLFPAESFADGFQQDLDPTAHFLIRLRLIHPMVAILVGTYIAGLIAVLSLWRPERTPRRLSRALVALILIQWGLGLINIALLAPIPLQIVHLLVADLIWILFVLFAQALARPSPSVQIELPVGQTLPGDLQP